MKKQKRRFWQTGLWMIGLFILWTVLIQCVDVQCAGQTQTPVGFATLNLWFHRLTGVHLWLYTITDWLGLVPIGICFAFGLVGLVQLLQRKSLLKVDTDLMILGIYYILIIIGYLVFEMIPINYRPILIEGRREASYPSSTTLLVLSVMPTLISQTQRRLHNAKTKTVVHHLSVLFSLFMVVGRLVSGVHWLTDIVGSALFSTGMFCIYQDVTGG